MKKTLLELTPKSTVWARKNPEKCAEQQRKVRNTLRGAINSKVSAARQRAKNKTLDFDIDIDFIQSMWEDQGGLCALTGLPMSLRGPKLSQESFDSFSIDRIDAKRGYTKDNVQLIKWGVNSIKSYMSTENFLSLVKQIYEFNDLGETE